MGHTPSSAAGSPRWKRRVLTTRGVGFSALEAGSGEVVLCVHGFPDHPNSFRHQRRGLGDRRIVAPTLRGYESATAGPVRLTDAADDLIGWMDVLGVERAHVVGHDWGAVLGWMAAARAPERFHSLSLLAVPPLAPRMLAWMLHPAQMRRSWYMAFFQLRGRAERAVLQEDLCLKLFRDWSPGFVLPAEEAAALRARFSNPAVVAGALSYYRDLPRSWWRLAQRPDVPVLSLYGDQDGCLQPAAFEGVRTGPRQRVVRVSGAGHFLHQEKPDVVNGLLRDWFADTQAP